MLWLVITYSILGGFLFGYDMGCINAALPKLLDLLEVPEPVPAQTFQHRHQILHRHLQCPIMGA